MKIKSNRWYFVFNSDYTKCYQFYGNKLMWVIGGKRGYEDGMSDKNK